MPLPDGYTMRDANADDIAAISALRESVGWAAHEWALRLVLEPPGRCFVVTSPDAETVVAVGSGMAYGAIGIVGNMVVAEEHRRRGLGAAVLEAVVAFLEGSGCSRMELFATSDGRPLYERHGFSLLGPMLSVRVDRRAALGPHAPGLHIERAGPDLLDALAAYDRDRYGADRTVVLRVALADPARPLLVARRGDALVGYAWVRGDGGRLGPLLADEPEVAGALIAPTLATSAGGQVEFNLPATNRAGRAWLQRAGATLDPWDGWMGRGPAVLRREASIYGNLLGALG